MDSVETHLSQNFNSKTSSQTKPVKTLQFWKKRMDSEMQQLSRCKQHFEEMLALWGKKVRIPYRTFHKFGATVQKRKWAFSWTQTWWKTGSRPLQVTSFLAPLDGKEKGEKRPHTHILIVWHPTSPFTILKLYNPELHKIRQSTDFKASKLWKGSSGRQKGRQRWIYFSHPLAGFVVVSNFLRLCLSDWFQIQSVNFGLEINEVRWKQTRNNHMLSKGVRMTTTDFEAPKSWKYISREW